MLLKSVQGVNPGIKPPALYKTIHHLLTGKHRTDCRSSKIRLSRKGGIMPDALHGGGGASGREQVQHQLASGDGDEPVAEPSLLQHFALQKRPSWRTGLVARRPPPDLSG